MSQNTHTLMLFFAEKAQLEQCAFAYFKLLREEEHASEALQEKLGVDLSTSWHETWFNQELKAHPSHLCIGFDTGTSDGPPLQLLQELFDHGLKAAVLETFYSQMGETERQYFVDGQRVGRARAYAARADIEALVLAEMGECHDCDASGLDRPVPVSRLIEQARAQEEEARTMVDGLVGLATLSRESGTSVFGLVKAFSVIGALGRGLLHALICTVVSVLLFKGVWLWVGLGLVLAVVLPLFYASRTAREFAEVEG